MAGGEEVIAPTPDTPRDPVRIIIADVRDGLRSLPERSVHCCVTSPPYWGLRDYGVDGQIGLEATPDQFVETMVDVFREVRRVLRDDATLWLNLGDSYARQGGSDETGSSDGATGRGDAARLICKAPICLKPKDLCMMPWRVALALQADGWWLRSVICWHKRSPMPESVTDRPTSSWEPIFLLAKSDRYFYDAEAVKEKSSEGTNARGPLPTTMPKTVIDGGGFTKNNRSFVEATWAQLPTRNMRNVWTLSNEPYSEAHFATFPSEIPRRAIKAGTSEKGCCPACGTPWERVVERTIGWKSRCSCPPAEPVPCLVLDPFLGSGTTIAAARQLGRHGVGIELNPAYADMARVRIAKAEKPHTYADHREQTEKGLFA